MELKVERYFVELEFKSNNGNTYWLPLFLKAESLEQAVKWFQNICLGIESKCDILKKEGPIPVVEGVNSKYRDDYAQNGLLFCRRAKVKMDIFELEELEYCEGKAYKEYMAMVDARPEDYAGKILANSRRIDLPVSVVNMPEDARGEFLVFDVVKPK